MQAAARGRRARLASPRQDKSPMASTLMHRTHVQPSALDMASAQPLPPAAPAPEAAEALSEPTDEQRFAELRSQVGAAAAHAHLLAATPYVGRSGSTALPPPPPQPYRSPHHSFSSAAPADAQASGLPTESARRRRCIPPAAARVECHASAAASRHAHAISRAALTTRAAISGEISTGALRMASS